MATYDLTAMQNPAKYITQLFRETDFDPRSALSVDGCAGIKDIYALSIAPLVTDPENYWIEWGGYFDNPIGFGWQVYLQFFLTQADSFNAMIAGLGSFYVDVTNNLIYIHSELPLWLYFLRDVALYSDDSSAFSTAVKNESNPSDVYYGLVKSLSIMAIPSFSSELSNVIGGVIKYDKFSITLFNQDGYFDSRDIINYFNTPIRVLKSTNNAQTLSEFKKIRSGVIDDISVSFESVQISGSDTVYQMSNSVCRTISTEEFPYADENIGANIPIGWGLLRDVELTLLWESGGTYYYLALDKDWITDVSTCYDDDGVSRAFSFNSITGVISSSYELATANVTGRTDRRIGTIIKELLVEFESFPFVDGVWDVEETQSYIDISADINFYVNDGTTKTAIENVLKNDIAFLIQKTNGLLTIRRWGEIYDVFNIPSWTITEKPLKDFADAYKYYCSSVRISYYNGSVLDDSMEAELYELYRKRYRANLSTVLRYAVDTEDLAERFLDRFANVKETLTVGFGCDTYQINLLDRINVVLEINGRKFSDYTSWTVKKINPGQDQVTLEAIE